MSFLHVIRVGFFGTQADRELRVEECNELLARFQSIVPSELQLAVCNEPRGDLDTGLILAYAGRYPVVLRCGTLFCPYLSTEYIDASIAFAVYVQLCTGSKIYSEDEDEFLTIDEVIPKVPFSEVMREVLARESREFY